MFVSEIAQYLQANGIGTANTNIFSNHLPSTPSSVIAIFNTGGNQASSALAFDEPTVQIRVRNTVSGALNKMAAIYNVLTGLKRTTLINNGTFIVSCKALQSSPQFLQRNDDNTFEYVQNYEFEIINDTLFRD